MSYREIYFTAWQGGENNYLCVMGQLGLTVRELWSSYNDHAMMEDAGLTREQMNAVFKARTVGHTNAPSAESLDLGNLDVYVLQVWQPSEDRVVRDLGRWIRQVAEDVEEVGGDDDYFDYYPDNFHVADQLAEHLPAFKPYLTQAKLDVCEARYDDDEGRDLIGLKEEDV